MLTLEHLRIFHKYGGDIDGWARSASKKDLRVMTDEQWLLIENFRQEIELINKGLMSQDFKDRVINNLEKLADRETQEHLMENKKPKFNSIFKRIFG